MKCFNINSRTACQVPPDIAGKGQNYLYIFLYSNISNRLWRSNCLREKIDFLKISSGSTAKGKILWYHRTLVKMSTCLFQCLIHWLVVVPGYFFTMEKNKLCHHYVKYMYPHRECFPL